MIEIKREVKTLAIIPARGGSKRLPRKNILPLAGKPLIKWTIDEAIKTKSIDIIAVSSDDDEVLEIAGEYSNIFLIKRPSYLSTDTSKSADVVSHALAYFSEMEIYPDRVLLLQPTSPLRNAGDIQNAIALFEKEKADSVISVCEIEHPTAWCGIISKDKTLVGFDFSVSRSQDAQQEYRINGAIYYFDRLAFLKKRQMIFENPIAFIMPKERSVDIDEFMDFKLCETLLLVGKDMDIY